MTEQTPDDRRRGGSGRDPGSQKPTGWRPQLIPMVAIVAVLLLFGLNYVFSDTSSEEINYSELKEKIAAGEIAKVTISDTKVVAEPTETAKSAGAPEEWTADKVEDPGLIQLVEEQGIEYDGAVSNGMGWVLNLIIPFGFLILIWVFLLRRMNPSQGVMTFGKSQARLQAEGNTGVTFADVAGEDEAEGELQEVVEFLKTPDKFSRLGAKIPKGILLVGPPGTGKTLLARAVAGEAQVPFFNLSGSGHDEREQTLNQLLVEMDGFDPRAGVIIMAATNRPELLDPALLRPGRFDRHVLVDRPDKNGRLAILEVHAREIKLVPEVDLDVVARRTPGFVGADLANLLNEAALLAARRGADGVTMEDIDKATDRIVAGLEKKNRLINEEEKRIVAFHEAGHAIVAECVDHADPVHKISIIPRGIGALGYTQQLPTEDRYLLTRAELEDRVAVLLGGRAAEEIVFDEISTGAQNDLSRVTEIARSMVVEYGMSDVLGPMTYENRNRNMLGMQQPMDFDGQRLSEETRQEIDREVRRIVDEAHDRVRVLLNTERKALDAVAERLLEREVIEGDELVQILNEHAPKGRKRKRERSESN